MRTFSCSVIGKGVVALECLKILEQAGHSVISIYSVDQSLQPWATERAIPHSHSRQDFQDLLYASQYDYLFSINNGWIIPPDVIARSRKATINYHNSPLPKYAGLHAASWALLQGETQHAIVWHEVVPEIDAGCILKYQSVPIEAEDTALSLNTRCFEAAIAAFAQLVIELADDRVQRLPQDLSQRSYFGLTDRPEAAGILTFDTSAQSICNLVHALDFEPILNPLGLPKLRLPNGVIAVRQARLEMKVLKIYLF